jgi:hypothetical protein
MCKNTPMSIAKTVATVVIATFGIAGCGHGVEGTYKFDKAETTKVMAAEMAKSAKGVPMPPGLAILAMAGLDRLEWTIELQAGGQLTMTTTALDATDVIHGTWTMDGDSILLTGDGKRLPAAGSKAIKCAKSSATLRCEIGNPNREVGLIFTKS